MKRTLDILGSLFGFAFTCVLYPFIAIAIVIDDGFPVVISLERISEGRIILVHKFRSMVRGAHQMKAGLMEQNERNDGPFFKIRHDPRLTSVGKILRKLRLDELPQFWDVLIGNLTLVGPRPHEPGEITGYPHEFKSLALAKSGLTGLSQVSGASSLPFKKELELDRWYLENASFLLDMKIIWKTIWLFISDPTGV